MSLLHHTPKAFLLPNTPGEWHTLTVKLRQWPNMPVTRVCWGEHSIMPPKTDARFAEEVQPGEDLEVALLQPPRCADLLLHLVLTEDITEISEDVWIRVAFVDAEQDALFLPWRDEIDKERQLNRCKEAIERLKAARTLPTQRAI